MKLKVRGYDGLCDTRRWMIGCEGTGILGNKQAEYKKWTGEKNLGQKQPVMLHTSL